MSTKLQQLRYTTYSDPREGKVSKGNLISKNGDDTSIFSNNNPIPMKVLSKDSTVTIASGDNGTINLSFVGQGSGGFSYSIGIYVSSSLTNIYTSETTSDYSDKSVVLNLPRLDDGTYELIYSIQSGDGTQTLVKDKVLTSDGTVATLKVEGSIKVGREFLPSEYGTISMIKDGYKLEFNSTTKYSQYGTSGFITLNTGNQGYIDYFPYFIFNIPNKSSGNYVFKVNSTKIASELGVPTSAPDLMLISPIKSAPVSYLETYRDGSTVKPDPTWSFSGGNGVIIKPAQNSSQLGIIEYDIPDDTMGTILVVLSTGLPYTMNPYSDAFGNTNYRDRERVMSLVNPSIYAKDSAASSSPVSFKELNIDLTDVNYLDAATILTTFGKLKIFPDLNTKIPNQNYISYPILKDTGDITVDINTSYGMWEYKDTLQSSTSTIKPTKIVSDTKIPNITVNISGALISNKILRQSQYSSSWSSTDIVFNISAYDSTPLNPVVFSSNEITPKISGLPDGASLVLSPMSSSGSSITYKGNIHNFNNVPLTSGQYEIKIDIIRTSGTKLGKYEVFTGDSFTIFLEPKI